MLRYKQDGEELLEVYAGPDRYQRTNERSVLPADSEARQDWFSASPLKRVEH